MNRNFIVQSVAICLGLFVSLSAYAQHEIHDSALQKVLPKMVEIKGGAFKMGDMAEEGDANELPVHDVTVSDFKMAATETTFDLYDLFATATGRELPVDEDWGRGQRPVVNVSWEDANAMIAWLNEQTNGKYRLPTEAEWEYAARAGTDTPYANGESITRDYANFGPENCCSRGVGQNGQDTFDYTAPVGSFLPNQFGLYDTVGNVWEWIADCYNDSYKGAPTDGSAWNTGDCTRSPMRGGSWSHYSRNIRPANRNENIRQKSRNGYGFRLAASL